MAKYFVVILLFTVIVSLMSALYFLVKDPNHTRRTVRALTLRIGLSLILFIFLMLSFWMGWLHPHGI